MLGPGASIMRHQIKQSKLSFEISEFTNLSVSSSILPEQHYIRPLLLLPVCSPLLASTTHEQQSPLVSHSRQLEDTPDTQPSENRAFESTHPWGSEAVNGSPSAPLPGLSETDMKRAKGPQGAAVGTRGRRRGNRDSVEAERTSKARTCSLGHLLKNSLTHSFDEEG